MKTRFLWADVIRILAIFLVLATHLSYQPDFVTTDGLIYFLYFAVVKTCIPLFVMLSGALLLGKSEPYNIFFKKRLGRLILPWVFWSIVYLFLQKESISSIHDLPTFIKTLIATMESFWFLPMIVCLYVLTPPIRTFIAHASIKEILYIIFIWFLVISFLPYHHNSMAFPRQVDDGLLRQVVNFFGYYLLGYIVVRMNKKITPIFSVLIFLVGLSWTTIMVLAANLPSEQIMFLFDYIAPGNALMSFGIFACLVSFLKNISPGRSRVHEIIGYVSQAALGIYFVHAIIWPYLHQVLRFKIYPLPYGIASVVALFVICFVIVFLLQKIPTIKKFVG